MPVGRGVSGGSVKKNGVDRKIGSGILEKKKQGTLSPLGLYF